MKFRWNFWSPSRSLRWHFGIERLVLPRSYRPNSAFPELPLLEYRSVITTCRLHHDINSDLNLTFTSVSKNCIIWLQTRISEPQIFLIPTTFRHKKLLRFFDILPILWPLTLIICRVNKLTAMNKNVSLKHINISCQTISEKMECRKSTIVNLYVNGMGVSLGSPLLVAHHNHPMNSCFEIINLFFSVSYFYDYCRTAIKNSFTISFISFVRVNLQSHEDEWINASIIIQNRTFRKYRN